MEIETFRTVLRTSDGRDIYNERRVTTHDDGTITAAHTIDGDLTDAERAELGAWLRDPSLPAPNWLD